jgi:hypothetical protein
VYSDSPAVPGVVFGGITIIRGLAGLEEISEVLAPKTNLCDDGVFRSKHTRSEAANNINWVKWVPGFDFSGGGSELSVVIGEKFFESSVGHLLFS